MSIVGVGIIFSIIGAFKLELTRVLKIDNVKVGGLISTLMFTGMIFIIIIGPLVDAFGHKLIVTIGFIFGFIGVFILISAKSYRIAVFGCIILGMSSMCLDTVGNTLLPYVLFNGQNAPAALNLGNSFYGLGAFATPFLVGLLLKKIGYKVTGNIFAFIFFVPFIFAVMANSYPQIPAGFSFAEAVKLLGNKIIISAALSLFCYVGIEMAMGGWISSYLNDIGFSEKRSNYLLSVFWISLMISRILAAGFVTPAIEILTITILSCGAVVSISLMVMAKSKGMGACAVILTGLVFGPIFPTVISVMFSKIENTALHGSAFGISFAIGLLGASIIPAAIGVLAKKQSIQKSLKLAIVTAVILVIMIVIMGQS